MIHVIRCPWIKEKEEECKTVEIYKELIVHLWPIPNQTLCTLGFEPSLVWELSKVTGGRTVNPLLSLPAGLFISSTFEGGAYLFWWNGVLYCFPKQSEVEDDINGPLPSLVCEQYSLRTIILFKTTIVGIQLYKINSFRWFPLTRFWLRTLTHANFNHVNKIEARQKVLSNEKLSEVQLLRLRAALYALRT